jgi:hypothetical protein
MAKQNWRKQAEKHGDTSGGNTAPEYTVWVTMIQRCTNPDAFGYERYGGRGIEVCQLWRNSYIAFLRDMGRRPSDAHSIERVDNDGHYKPGNCIWSNDRNQSRNRVSNKFITAFGKTQILSDWANGAGITASAISKRLAKGLLPEEALTIAPQRNRRTSLTLRGETLTVTAWAKRAGKDFSTVNKRLEAGWSAEDAVFGEPGLYGYNKSEKMLTVGKVAMSIVDWSNERGINRTTIEERLKRGWSVEDSVMLPVGRRPSR